MPTLFLKDENNRLRDTIEVMRDALERARPYVSELCSFSNSAECHRDVLRRIDRALGISD